MCILYLLIWLSFSSCFYVLQNWGFSFNHLWRIFLSLLVPRNFSDDLFKAPLLPSSSAVRNPAMPLQWTTLCSPFPLLWPLQVGHSLLFSLLSNKNTCSNSAGVLWESSVISSPPLLPYLSLPPYPSYFQEDLRSQDCRMTVANIIHPWCVSGTTKVGPSRPY